MKKLISIALAVVFMLTACSKTEESKAESGYTFTDSLGREISVSSYEKAVIASGSLAEIWELAGGTVYGATDDALDGHNLKDLDKIKIYGEVKHPSVENIIADNVDFVILSASIATQVELADTLGSAGVTAAYFDVEDFEQYLSMLKICTEITGREDLYAENGTAVQEKVNAAIQKSEGKEKPDILLLRAYSTGVKAKGSDNMTGKMLADFGCVNIADSDSSLLEELSLEAIVRADPDFVFITTMGEDEQAAIAQYESTLASNPAWQELTAVKNNEVHILPKDLYHYKPNARWGEAYEKLEEILYEG